MEAKYFKNQLRGYSVALGILKAQSEDQFCQKCIGLEGAITKVEKRLRKLKLDLAGLAASGEEKDRFISQIEQLSQQVGNLPVGEEPT